MWAILLILIVFFILKNRSQEHFYGMNYIQQHNYLKCCYNLGCTNPVCEKYLITNRRKLQFIGYLYNINGNKLFNNINNQKLKLYIKHDKFNNKYYIKILNKINKYVYYKLNTNNVQNNNLIKLNNSKFRVYLTDNYTYNPIFRNKYFKNKNYQYPEELYALKYGYLKPDDLNSTDFISLYKKKYDNNMNYYVKKGNNFIKIDKDKDKNKDKNKINFLNYDKTQHNYQLIN